MTVAENFLTLFSPYSPKSFGEYREGASLPARTIKLMVALGSVEAHLNGKVGLGLVPLSGDRCAWGVIDIDNHGDGEDLDLHGMARKMSSFPGTVVCRSKSGGLHIYFFFKDVLSGKEVRGLIHQVAMATDLAGNEVFPKQSKIRSDGFGNWINLPYFEGDDTNRYGITPEGQKMSLERFLSTPRATVAEIESAIEAVSIGAPPCIEHLLAHPPMQGHRNMALFSIAVFYKRSSPGTWQDKTREYASKRMDPPLDSREISTVIRSVGRTDYMYRCTEPPLLDLCDKDKCLLARHGVSAEQQSKQGEPVPVTSLVKYLTEPPIWDLHTELGPIRISTKALLSHSMVREAIAERYLKIIPRLKNDEWHSILSDLMASCKVYEVPEDSTPAGLVFAALVEYASAAYSNSYQDKTDEEVEEDQETRWDAGLPIERKGVIHFSGSRFIAWLRRAKRAEGYTPSMIFMALKEKGITQTRTRLGPEGHIKRTWSFSVGTLRKAYPTYKAEEEDF